MVMHPEMSSHPRLRKGVLSLVLSAILIWALAGVAILGIEKGGEPARRQQWKSFFAIKKFLLKSHCSSLPLHAATKAVMPMLPQSFVTREARQRRKWSMTGAEEKGGRPLN